MTVEPITVDTAKVSAKVTALAGQYVQEGITSLAAPVVGAAQTLESFGIGGSGISSFTKWIQDFLSSIGTSASSSISSVLSYFFGSTPAPAATTAPSPAASTPASSASPEVSSPGRTPGVPQAERPRGRP